MRRISILCICICAGLISCGQRQTTSSLDRALYHLDRGNKQMRNDEFELAAVEYTRALDERPDMEVAKDNLALAKRRAENRQYLLAHPDDDDARKRMCYAYASRRMYRKAEEHAQLIRNVELRKVLLEFVRASEAKMGTRESVLTGVRNSSAQPRDGEAFPFPIEVTLVEYCVLYERLGGMRCEFDTNAIGQTKLLIEGFVFHGDAEFEFNQILIPSGLECVRDKTQTNVLHISKRIENPTKH